MNCYSIYITTHDTKEAQEIGNVLIDERLAACVTILGEANSIFRWQGKIQKPKEVVMYVKTSEAKLQQLIAKVKQIHSYEYPCIVALPIFEGNKEYIDWIIKETT